jgi:hypothetical protein
MKYFLPDSQDLVDPSFDFTTEGRSKTRVRQRDDVYTHELFPDRAIDGILVSKGIVDGFGTAGGRYSIAQRHRLVRVGAPNFFRVRDAKCGPLPIMGDCGAFTYVNEDVPPYSVEDVVSFYLDCQFNYGLSVDHAILEYEPAWDNPRTLPGEARKDRNRAVRRQELTIELAAKFFKVVKLNRLFFRPLGVAQGWSPKSYARAVTALQKIGYTYIAVGGMVPLKTAQIRETLATINEVRSPQTQLHLLGVTRTESMLDFKSFGVASFDSTSPLLQAFKDKRDNYYTMDRAYAAIRIPQVEGNAKLERAIRAGWVSQPQAQALEKACLDVMARFDRQEATVADAVLTLRAYEELFERAEGRVGPTRRDHTDVYREVLEASPWRHCPCAVCRALGHHVILFRGAERNRRRGLHNVWVFYRRLQQQLRKVGPEGTTARRTTQLSLDAAEAP